MSDTSPIEAIFGGCPVEVQLYDDAGATGDLIDGTRLASLTIHRGRQNATDRVEAGTFSFTLTGGLNEAGDVVELGRRLRIRLAAGVIDAALPGLDASAHPRITGLVTDVGDVDVTPTASAAVAPVAGVSSPPACSPMSSTPATPAASATAK